MYRPPANAAFHVRKSLCGIPSRALCSCCVLWLRFSILSVPCQRPLRGGPLSRAHRPTLAPYPSPGRWPGFASTTGWGCGIRQRAALIPHPPLRCTPPSPVAPDPQCPVVAPPEDHLHRLSRSNLGVPREVPQRTVAAKRGVARLGLGLHATFCHCLSVGNSLFRLKQALLPANRRPGPRL